MGKEKQNNSRHEMGTNTEQAILHPWIAEKPSDQEKIAMGIEEEENQMPPDRESEQ
ncbi:MAG TPA: hypothetical protein VE973_02195 [Candidatus Limnocylindria bacterium]|nr:hypothetical protein [Candidatus Limnocylindria bacterium]